MDTVYLLTKTATAPWSVVWQDVPKTFAKRTREPRSNSQKVPCPWISRAVTPPPYPSSPYCTPEVGLKNTLCTLRYESLQASPLGSSKDTKGTKK